LLPQIVILSDRNGFSHKRVAAKDLALNFHVRSFANIRPGEIPSPALRMTVLKDFRQRINF
jgi:hypothetical protein